MVLKQRKNHPRKSIISCQINYYFTVTLLVADAAVKFAVDADVAVMIAVPTPFTVALEPETEITLGALLEYVIVPAEVEVALNEKVFPAA